MCVGSQVRHFHLYDLRISGTTAAPSSTWAHSDAVCGIAADHSRQDSVIATFGRTAGEPVKLWDLRRMDTAVGEIKVNSSNTVSAIEWSDSLPGTLSVACGDSVQSYDTTASLSRPVLARYNRAELPIVDFALFPQSHFGIDEGSGEERNQQQQVSELFRNRMLVVLADKTVKDIAMDTMAPLAISRRDGCLAHSFGGALWIEPSSEGPSAMEHPTALSTEDVSARMMRRAKCSRAARYSMDAASNLQMLSEEDDELGDEADLEGMLPSIKMLIRLWSWIERIERFCSQREAYGAEKWPGRGLADSGVLRLLHLDHSAGDSPSNKDSVVFDEALSIDTYESPRRRYVCVSFYFV